MATYNFDCMLIGVEKCVTAWRKSRKLRIRDFLIEWARKHKREIPLEAVDEFIREAEEQVATEILARDWAARVRKGLPKAEYKELEEFALVWGRPRIERREGIGYPLAFSQAAQFEPPSSPVTALGPPVRERAKAIRPGKEHRKTPQTGRPARAAVRKGKGVDPDELI